MTETQPTRKEKIAKIYEVIARKNLSMGCLIQRYENTVDTVLHVENLAASVFWCLRMQNGYLYSETTTRDNIEKCTIIGHPVMIGDVLEWGYKNRYHCPKCKSRNVTYEDDIVGEYGQIACSGGYMCHACEYESGRNYEFGDWEIDLMYVINHWKKLREPIDSQSDDCVDYVYSLIESLPPDITTEGA